MIKYNPDGEADLTTLTVGELRKLLEYQDGALPVVVSVHDRYYPLAGGYTGGVDEEGEEADVHFAFWCW